MIKAHEEYRGETFHSEDCRSKQKQEAVAQTQLPDPPKPGVNTQELYTLERLCTTIVFSQTMYLDGLDSHAEQKPLDQLMSLAYINT